MIQRITTPGMTKPAQLIAYEQGAAKLRGKAKYIADRVDSELKKLKPTAFQLKPFETPLIVAEVIDEKEILALAHELCTRISILSRSSFTHKQWKKQKEILCYYLRVKEHAIKSMVAALTNAGAHNESFLDQDFLKLTQEILDWLSKKNTESEWVHIKHLLENYREKYLRYEKVEDSRRWIDRALSFLDMATNPRGVMANFLRQRLAATDCHIRFVDPRTNAFYTLDCKRAELLSPVFQKIFQQAVKVPVHITQKNLYQSIDTTQDLADYIVFQLRMNIPALRGESFTANQRRYKDGLKNLPLRQFMLESKQEMKIEVTPDPTQKYQLNKFSIDIEQLLKESVHWMLTHKNVDFKLSPQRTVLNEMELGRLVLCDQIQFKLVPHKNAQVVTAEENVLTDEIKSFRRRRRQMSISHGSVVKPHLDEPLDLNEEGLLVIFATSYKNYIYDLLNATQQPVTIPTEEMHFSAYKAGENAADNDHGELIPLWVNVLTPELEKQIDFAARKAFWIWNFFRRKKEKIEDYYHDHYVVEHAQLMFKKKFGLSGVVTAGEKKDVSHLEAMVRFENAAPKNLLDSFKAEKTAEFKGTSYQGYGELHAEFVKEFKQIFEEEKLFQMRQKKAEEKKHENGVFSDETTMTATEQAEAILAELNDKDLIEEALLNKKRVKKKRQSPFSPMESSSAAASQPSQSGTDEPGLTLSPNWVPKRTPNPARASLSPRGSDTKGSELRVTFKMLQRKSVDHSLPSVTVLPGEVSSHSSELQPSSQSVRVVVPEANSVSAERKSRLRSYTR